WDAATGKPTRHLKGHTDSVWSVAWSPDGAQIATASGDQTAIVWDAATGKPTRHLKGHTDWVWSVAWSPDGAQIATSSRDGTTRIWRVGAPPVGQLPAEDNTSCVAIYWTLPDGETCSTNGDASQITGATANAWRHMSASAVIDGRLRWLPAEAFGPLPAYADAK
ncbi:MAG: hypothetical protein LBO20_07070, partial [Bifidobacteriaceae bacterium]|nr:hypothetical protein [Bifidobacteriaceae bacterium]